MSFFDAHTTGAGMTEEIPTRNARGAEVMIAGRQKRVTGAAATAAEVAAVEAEVVTGEGEDKIFCLKYGHFTL